MTVRLIAVLLACFVLPAAHAQPAGQLSLRDAVRTALEKNPRIRASRAASDAASARATRAISPPQPILSAEYNFIPRGTPLSAHRERHVAISQTIDFPVVYPLRAAEHAARVRESEAFTQALRAEIATAVKILYASVLACERKSALARENLALAEDFSRKTAIRRDVGEGTQLESSTARMLATQAANDAANADLELEAARGALATEMGLPLQPDAAAPVLSDSLGYAPFPFTDAEALAQVVRVNPRLRASDERVAAASAGVSLAWTSLLPSLTASYAWQKDDMDDRLHGFAFGISVPLWFALDQRGQIEEAGANRIAAEEERAGERNLTAQQAASALIELRKYERQVLLHQQDILPQASDVFRVAGASWDAGEVSYLELIQARKSLIAARSAYIDALFDYHRARARLEGLLDITGIE